MAAASLSSFNLLLRAPRFWVSLALCSGVSSFFGFFGASGTKLSSPSSAAGTATKLAAAAGSAMARAGHASAPLASAPDASVAQIWAKNGSRRTKNDRGPFASPRWAVFLAPVDRNGGARTRCVAPLESSLVLLPK